jgi:hypothetical protein
MASLRIESAPLRWPVAPTVAGGLGLAGALVALLHLDHLPFSFCFFKTVTGMPCMTCGTTRALGHLVRLHPWSALRVNPLATMVMGGLLVYALLDLVLLASGQSLSVQLTSRQARWLWGLFGVALLVNWGYLIAHGV